MMIVIIDRVAFNEENMNVSEISYQDLKQLLRSTHHSKKYSVFRLKSY